MSLLIKKRLVTLFILLNHPKIFRKALKGLFHRGFEDYHLGKSPIPSICYYQLFPIHEFYFETTEEKNGRVSLKELMILCSLVRHFKPKRILEIGTFDGVTTYHLARNSSQDAHLWTLDLPYEKSLNDHHNKEDLQFIENRLDLCRRFINTPMNEKITQLFGDSRKTIFPSSMDFIFIDGGHDETCIRNDTLKAFEALSDHGIIVWHDYSPHTFEVFKYLNSLSKSLIHIQGTSLVIYTR